MTKLFLTSYGDGDDIILLHGWGTHGIIWQDIVEQLAKDFKVTVVDLPGFGHSIGVVDYRIERVVAELIQVTPVKACWIGWSLGGLIATKFALMHPDRVTKLICVASSPKFVKEQNWPGVDASVLTKFSEQLSCNYDATLKRFLQLQFYGVKVDKNRIEQIYNDLFSLNRPSMAVLNASLDLLKNLDLRAEMSNLSCPILYLLGKLDVLVPSAIQPELRNFSQKIDSIVLPKASHALFLSHQDEFLKEVKNFL